MSDKWLLLLPFTLAVLAIAPLPSKPTMMVWEAEGYAEIVEPMRMVRSDPEASGGALLQLPLGSGQGWRNKGGGSVAYRLDIPRTGNYVIWSRALWGDGCTNAVFLQANEGSRMVFGNDAEFGRWHWVKGQQLTLEKGVNYLHFSNHSDGIALDKFVLTNDPLYTPAGLGEGITSFYDGFAGCDADNTGSWEFLSGNWRVIRGVQEATGVNDCLAQSSLDESVALAGYSVWHDYDLEAKAMLSGPGVVGLIFLWRENNEYRLLLSASEQNATLSLEHYAEGTRQILASVELEDFQYDTWCQLGYRRTHDGLTCFLNSRVMLKVPFLAECAGQIGLTTSGGVAYFDNVNVKFCEKGDDRK